MVSPAIPESPTARLLLELAVQRASCEVPFGQRVVVLCDGQISDISCDEPETSLDAFLVAAGRLEERERTAVVQLASEQGVSVEHAVLELALIDPEALIELKRAQLLERLVRAFAAHDESLPRTRPIGPAPRGRTFDTCGLVLDALARRAALGPAEQVGALRQARFVWNESALEKRAVAWADIGDVPHAMSVAMLFPRHPAAAPRIAALVAAGLARLDVGSVSNAPPAMLSGAPVGSARPPHVVTMRPVEIEGQGVPTVPTPPPKARGPLELEPPNWWLPSAQVELDDPLSALESQVAEADAQDEPVVRANAWLNLAAGFRLHQRSLLEATRAAREAAAAAPEHPEALALAAELCAASGHPELAYPYAMAWSTHATTPQERARALSAASVYARRQGRPDAALAALRSAVGASPEDPVLEERLARALAERGEVQAAVELAHQSAEHVRASDPFRARLTLSWAARLAPANLRTWNLLAKQLVRMELPALAVATLAHAARMQSDSAARERLRASAISFAEQVGDPRAAAAISLESHDVGHGQGEALASELHAAEAWPELAIIAEQAASASHGSEKANLLLLAAEAHRYLSGGVDTACQLLAEALCADPNYARVSETIAAFAGSPDDARPAIEALERALSLTDDKYAVARHLLPLLGDDAGAPLSLWLQGQLPELTLPTDIEERKLRFDHTAHELEHALRSAGSHERTRPALELAAWLRRDPERRTIARKLYQKVLEREPSQRAALHGLHTLLQLDPDPAVSLAFLAQRAQREASPSALLSLAYAALRTGEPARALESAMQALPSTAAVSATASAEEQEACVLAWRIATLLGDPVNAEIALTAWAERGVTPAARAQAWLLLAQRTGSRTAAESALANDPSSPDAALILLDSVEQLSTAASIPVLRALRGVLGDLPELLRALARASFAASDANGQREALEALSVLTPDDGFAARALVALRTTGRDADALAQTLAQALAPARFSVQTNYVAQRGLARLSELWGAERTLELALPLLESLGEPARSLLAATDTLAASVSAERTRAAQLELRAAHAADAERAPLLRRLAALHRESGAGWAAIRCELRLLELEPEDREAVEHLVALYAEHGELERLHGALESLVESAPNADERRARLLDLALVTARTGEDSLGAALLVERAFAEGHEEGSFPSREQLQRGLGLMIESAPQRAFTAMLTLAQRAPGELSRDLLAEALVLGKVTLAEPALALTAASQGAFRHPDHEPFVQALEELSSTDEQPELVISALDAAADRCEQPERQAELLMRAAKLSEERLDDPGRACLLLDRAYRATPTKPIENLWVATAARLFARDVRAGKRAYDRLRDTLHVRAKFGSSASRAIALITLARLAAEVYLNREDAIGYADAARAALDGDPASQDEERTTAQAELAALAAKLGHEPAPPPPPPQRASTARRSFADGEAPMLGLAHSAPTLRPSSGSLAPPIAGLPIARIVPSTVTLLVSEPPVALGALAPVAITTAAPAWSGMIAALFSGDGAANKALSDLLTREREVAAPLCTELLARARKEGFSTIVLRGLRLAAAASNRHALWRTSSQALAYAESALRPPPGPRQRDLRAGRMEHALLEARRCEHAGVLSLLAQIAENASPLFRKTPANALGLTKDPEPVKSGVHAQVLGELAQIFGVKHEAYLARNADNRVSVFSAQPASIVIGGRTPPDANELRFRLARAFEYARNDNVLVISHNARGLDALFQALRAAFTPAAATQVPREAAALAAELWRTMPSKSQRTLSARVAELGSVPDHAELLREVQLRGARCGLFVTRELDLALAQLGQDGDPSDYAVEHTEGALNRALESNLFVRALFDYAFSDAYLDALLDNS